MRSMQRSLAASAVLALSMLAAAPAQVLDADCFSGSCGGQKGVPQCPEGFSEVGFVLYANSKANATNDCETVVSCTNLGRRSVDISCRFYHGFNPIRPGGPTDALCSAFTPNVAPGDTNECATDSTAAPAYQAGGIFLAGDGDCPTFEGKGLVCAKGGDPDQVFCEAHLVCGHGTVLENIRIVSRKDSEGKDTPPGHEKR
jgi:hypothetical protein